MDQREQFIRRFLANDTPMSVLCSDFGISRKTGYKWAQRFVDGGLPNLVDRSRAPHTIAHAIDEAVAQRIVELRQRHPFWGPKKLRAWLIDREPAQLWPAASTIGIILNRSGLVIPRRRRRRTPMANQPLAACTAPNITWCADFKGCFRVGKRYCHPLTITDGYSRFLLRCEAMDGERCEPVRRAFEVTFREHGLPLRVRTDNGSPFATRAVGGLSRLSVWWIKLGVTPERIQPGKPQQNGRHERMHRTLKQETTRPAKSSVLAQQDAFDRFRQSFNHERPHEALGQRTPASVYEHSSRPMPTEPHDPEYPADFEIRRVRKDGRMAWRGGLLCVADILANEAIGVEPIADGRWQLWFGPIYLGILQEGAKGKHTMIKNLPVTKAVDA